MRSRKHPRPRLTDVLVEMGAADKDVLERASIEYYDRRYGAWLVAQGHITQSALDLALARQAAESGDYESAREILLSASDSMHNRVLGHIDGLNGTLERINRNNVGGKNGE